MIVLDTNVLVDLHRYVLDPAADYGASILSRAELEYGVHVARGAAEIAARTRRLNELDRVFAWLPFDLESSRAYGVLASQARATGARVRGKDALIAAQALRHGAAVMTANVADFRPFDALVEVVAPVPR